MDYEINVFLILAIIFIIILLLYYLFNNKKDNNEYLEEKDFGWDYSLNNPVLFSSKLDQLAFASQEKYKKIK